MNKIVTYPLSHPQQRIWYTEKLYPGTSMWNNAGTLKIKGKLDYDLLRQASQIFIKDNPCLRLQFAEEDGRPFQYISDFIPDEVDFVDLSDQGVQALYKWDKSQTLESYNIIHSPLYYIAVIKLSDNEGCLYAKMHHLISDALSMVSFSGTVMKCYDKLLHGITPQPGDYTLGNYLDFLAEEEKYMESSRYESDRQYWLNRFSDFAEPTAIKPRPAGQSTRASRKTYNLDDEISGRIRDFCTQKRISEFTLFFSALAIFINRTSGRKDIVINTPVYNRTNKTSKNAFGMFVSTVPLRLDINEELSFTQFAEGVSDMWFSSLKHQKFPYDVLLHELRKNGGISDAPSDITMSYQTAMFEKTSELFTYEGRWHYSGHQAGGLNIHLNDRDAGGKYIIDYDYLTPMFTLKEIEYIHLHLLTIIDDILTYPDKPVYAIDILTAEEREKILVQFNDTYHPFPKGQTLTQVWRERVTQAPDDTAVICADESFSYSDIDFMASALAKKLRTMGVGPDKVVGVVMNRSAQVIAAQLGILMAGGAFLPIDPELPHERALYMLDNSDAQILVTTSRLAQRFKEQKIPVVIMDGERTESIPEIINSSTDLAYIIYTSGSTGKPKGVMIEHGMLLHYIYATGTMLHYTRGYNILCASSISFDISVMEIYCTLMSGGTLVMAMEHEVNIPSNMTSLIKRANVNEMVLTPGRLELLLSDPEAESCLQGFADIVMGGDVLPPTLLQRLQKITKARLFNFYGPTEITIAATCKDVTNSKEVNIGRPLMNVKTYILDKHLNPVPINVIGELYIGGDGVARGYINNPELTEQRFIDNPFCPGERLYKTGDLTRYYPLGEVEFLGRSDNQIKIRGYRVELGEIEEHIKRINGIGMCAVCAIDEAMDRKALCAYICGDNIPSISEIKAVLSQELPAYMVPSHYMVIDSLPLNNSAKIDRSKLPKPESKSQRNEGEQPSTDMEKKIAVVWCELLGLSNVSRSENFFDLGGDSLSIIQCVTMIKNKLGAEINLEELYRNPTLANCASLAERSNPSTSSTIIPTSRKLYYPASSAQKRMYAIQKSQPLSLAYNMPMLFELGDGIECGRLEKAFQKLIKRHEALRTVLLEKDGEIVQRIKADAEFKLAQKSCGKGEVKRTVHELIEPFNLSNTLPVRAAIITSDKKYLFIDMHHSVSDMQSVKLLFSELETLYFGRSLSPVPLQYKDYAVWQQEWLNSSECKRQEKFWKEHLSGELPVLNLSLSKRRGNKQSFLGGEERVTLSKDITDSLRVVTRAYGATMFMIMFAAYNLLLSKYTGAEDIIVAVPHHGRSRSELRDTAGMFVGTLPIRSKPQGSMTMEQFLKSVKENCENAFASSEYPLEKILAGINISRDPSRNPLFDTMFVYQAGTEDALSLKNLHLKQVKLPSFTSKVDLTLEIIEANGGLDCRFEYDKTVCDREFIKRMAKIFLQLLSTLSDKLDFKLSQLNILHKEEYDKLTRGFSGERREVKGDVAGVFEVTAAQYADKNALIACDGTFSFSELNKKSNAIAYALMTSGVKPGDIVAVAVKRTSGLISSIIGVLKAGAAYLPIDLAYPYDRIAFMLSDSAVKTVILDSKDEKDIHFTGKRLYLDEIGWDENNPAPSASPSDPSYVIYTSGSTGVPKGVALTRLGLQNLYEGMKEALGHDPDRIVMCVTTASFDMFTADTLIQLMAGCTVVLCDEEQMRQAHLTAALIEKHSANFLQTTPTRLSVMMEDKTFRNALSRIKLILCGGEKWAPKLVRSLRRYTRAKLFNGYAPSETTVYSTFSEIKDADRVTIGYPIQNTMVYLLDKYGQPVPIGAQGEAYIGGHGVGIGYINRFELTDERFLSDPFTVGRMYRTGDICSYTPDGEILIYGRSDEQIKLRGQRIELGEIETCTKSCPGIFDAVVKYYPDNSGFLCCYYIASHNIDEAAIRVHLSARLPLFMVPSYFVRMDTFPTTSSGKTDRKSLPYPQKESTVENNNVMTRTERKLAKIWSKILQVKYISKSDDFFVLGGDSISVIKVQAAMYACGMNVSTRDFYALRTLEAIAAASFRTTTQITHVPRQRKTIADKPLAPVKLDKVLLTGATGYAGAHILAELVEVYGSEVCCLVRGKDEKTAKKALYDTLSFYFGEKADKYMDSVTLLRGDVSLPGLGITDSIKELTDIGCVIHSAALTSHVGSALDFEKANVKGTENVTAFCKKSGVPLLHISTMSVSGTHCSDGEDEECIFNESCYYIGQNYEDNDYVKSKFLAEGIVLDEAEKGLDVLIFRAGNLTGRYTDGGFQKNPSKNAFARKITAIAKMESVACDMLETQIEMTPVDLFAKALLAIAAKGGSEGRIFHLYNPNTITCRDLVEGLRHCGYDIKEISVEEFTRKINQAIKNGKQSAALSVLHEMTDTRNRSRVLSDASKTCQLLNNVGFQWPKIKNNYIKMYINEFINNKDMI